MKQNRDKQKEFSYAVVGCGMLIKGSNCSMLCVEGISRVGKKM